MIRLTKGPIPPVLAVNAAAWTNELLVRIATGDEPTKYQLGRYNKPEIKNALLAETKMKCAYCESNFRHVTYGDIEHITPKAGNPAVRFDWENLTIACDVCNTNKGEVMGLVDPYSVDPCVLYDFQGPLMWAISTDASALLTEEQLQLNRDGLVERRKERIDFVRSLVVSALDKPEDVRNALLRRASLESGSDKAYSACATAALERLKLQHGL